MKAYTAWYLERNTWNIFTIILLYVLITNFLNISVYFKPSSSNPYNFHEQYSNPHMLEMITAFDTMNIPCFLIEKYRKFSLLDNQVDYIYINDEIMMLVRLILHSFSLWLTLCLCKSQFEAQRIMLQYIEINYRYIALRQNPCGSQICNDHQNFILRAASEQNTNNFSAVIMSIFNNKPSKTKRRVHSHYLNFSKMLTYEWCKNSVSDVDCRFKLLICNWIFSISEMSLLFKCLSVSKILIFPKSNSWLCSIEW